MPTTHDNERPGTSRQAIEKEPHAYPFAETARFMNPNPDDDDDDDDDDDESIPARPPDNGWIPSRRAVASSGDIYKLIENFSGALRRSGFSVIESELRDKTAEVLRRLDRGEVAAGDAMVFVKETIRKIKTDAGIEMVMSTENFLGLLKSPTLKSVKDQKFPQLKERPSFLKESSTPEEWKKRMKAHSRSILRQVSVVEEMLGLDPIIGGPVTRRKSHFEPSLAPVPESGGKFDPDVAPPMPFDRADAKFDENSPQVLEQQKWQIPAAVWELIGAFALMRIGYAMMESDDWTEDTRSAYRTLFPEKDAATIAGETDIDSDTGFTLAMVGAMQASHTLVRLSQDLAGPLFNALKAGLADLWSLAWRGKLPDGKSASDGYSFPEPREIHSLEAGLDSEALEKQFFANAANLFAHLSQEARETWGNYRAAARRDEFISPFERERDRQSATVEETEGVFEWQRYEPATKTDVDNFLQTEASSIESRIRPVESISATSYGGQRHDPAITDDVEAFLRAQNESDSSLLNQRVEDLAKEVRAFKELVADAQEFSGDGRFVTTPSDPAIEKSVFFGEVISNDQAELEKASMAGVKTVESKKVASQRSSDRGVIRSIDSFVSNMLSFPFSLFGATAAQEEIAEMEAGGFELPFADAEEYPGVDQEIIPKFSEEKSEAGTYVLNHFQSKLIVGKFENGVSEYFIFLPNLGEGINDERYIDLDQSKLFFEYSEEDGRNGDIVLKGFLDRESKIPAAYILVMGDVSSVENMRNVFDRQMPIEVSIMGGEGELTVDLRRPFDSCEIFGLHESDAIKIRLPKLNGEVDQRAVKKDRSLSLVSMPPEINQNTNEAKHAFQRPEKDKRNKRTQLLIEGDSVAVNREATRLRKSKLSIPQRFLINKHTSHDDLTVPMEGADDECFIDGIPHGGHAYVWLPNLNSKLDKRAVGMSSAMYFRSSSGIKSFADSSDKFCIFINFDDAGHIVEKLEISGEASAVAVACNQIQSVNNAATPQDQMGGDADAGIESALNQPIPGLDGRTYIEELANRYRQLEIHDEDVTPEEAVTQILQGAVNDAGESFVRQLMELIGNAPPPSSSDNDSSDSSISERKLLRIARDVGRKVHDPGLSLNLYNVTATNYALLDAQAKSPQLRTDPTDSKPAWGIIKSATGTYELVTAKSCRRLEKDEKLTILEVPSTDVEISSGRDPISVDFMKIFIAGEDPSRIDETEDLKKVNGMWTATFAMEGAEKSQKRSFILRGPDQAVVQQAVRDWNLQISKYEEDKANLLRPNASPYKQNLWYLPDTNKHKNPKTLFGHGISPLDEQMLIDDLQADQLLGPKERVKYLANYQKIRKVLIDMHLDSPLLGSMADEYMKEILKEVSADAFGGDFDPSKNFVCKFEPKIKLVPTFQVSLFRKNWGDLRFDEKEADGGYRYKKDKAAWCVPFGLIPIVNFDVEDVAKGSEIDEELGLYRRNNTNTELGMESRFQLPSGGYAKVWPVVLAMQKNDFSKFIERKLKLFWEKNRRKYADALWDIFLLKLMDESQTELFKNYGLNSNDFRRMLDILNTHNPATTDGATKGKNGLSDSKIQRFSIGTYMASDMLVFENPDDGSLILYMPQKGQSFFKFKDAKMFENWVLEQAKDPVLKGNLAGHFSSVNRQKGTPPDARFAGVDALLDAYCSVSSEFKPSMGVGCGPSLFTQGYTPTMDIFILSKMINNPNLKRQVTGDPFKEMTGWAEGRNIAEAEARIRSSADVAAEVAKERTEAIESFVLTEVMMFPGPIGEMAMGIAAIESIGPLNQSLTKAIFTGKTKQERKQAWLAVGGGFAGLVLMGFALKSRVGQLWKRTGGDIDPFAGNSAYDHPDVSQQLNDLVESSLERKGGLSHQFPASQMEGYVRPELKVPENLEASASTNPELQEVLETYSNWEYVKAKVIAKDGGIPHPAKVDEILLMTKNAQESINLLATKKKPGLPLSEIQLKLPTLKSDIKASVQENLKDRAEQMEESLNSYNEEVGVSPDQVRALRDKYQTRLNDHFDQITNSPLKLEETDVRDLIVNNEEFPDELKRDSNGFYFYKDRWYADIFGKKICVDGVNTDGSLRFLSKDGGSVPRENAPFVTQDFNEEWRPRERTNGYESSFNWPTKRGSKYFISMEGLEHEVEFDFGTCRWVHVEDTHFEMNLEGKSVPSKTLRLGYKYNFEKGTWVKENVDFSVQASKREQADILMHYFGYEKGLPPLPQFEPATKVLGRSAADSAYYEEWQAILQDPRLSISENMRAGVVPKLKKFAESTFERKIDIPLTDVQRQELQSLLTERSQIQGVVTNYHFVDDLNKKNFEVPLTLYRAHVGDNVEEVGLQRSAGAASDTDDYLAQIIMHTARKGGSEGRVLSLSARSAKARNFQELNPAAKLRPIYTESEPTNFRTAADIIAKDGPRLVRGGKILKRTLFSAMDMLDEDEWEVFYIPGDIPPSLLKFPGAESPA